MTKETNKQIKNLKSEIEKLKSKIFDMDTENQNRINQVVNQLNQVSAVVDFHAHPMMSGRAIFLEDQYRTAVEAMQAQAAQTVPQPAPVEEPVEE